jgi:3-oxoadipate enol-lactonase
VRRRAFEAAASVSSRLVEVPGRGVTRVWECAGPPGAETLVLIHGVGFTAELNWGKVLEPLGRRFRVVALDLRGHGQGIATGARFNLEECADDVAALAAALGIERFVPVGYSMGGIIAQLVYRRHRSAVSGLVLCATTRNVRGSPVERVIALALPTMAATIQWNPMVQVMGAEVLGPILLGYVSDAATRDWAREQLRRTSLTTSVAAMQAVCEFTSHDWIGQVGVPTAVVITTRDRIVPPGRQRKLALAIPGAMVYEVDGDHGVCVTSPVQFSRTLLAACQSVEQTLANEQLTTAAGLPDPA